MACLIVHVRLRALYERVQVSRDTTSWAKILDTLVTGEGGLDKCRDRESAESTS